MDFRPLQRTFMQDDGSIDEAVICIVAGTFAMIFFEAWDIQTADFSPMAFGGGMGAMWGAAGALMRFRPPSQPSGTISQ